jgi:hypothetical protein
MHLSRNSLNRRSYDLPAHTERIHDQLQREGRELKIFTAIEVDEAVRKAFRSALVNVNDTMAGLIWRTCAAKVTADVMCNLGLGKPEQFYE